MANKKTYSKRQKDLKSKLMAAVCMLLVSSIMLVSSTYAWFTLSTAPEVTGINTQVGANGNLEMALMNETFDLTNIQSNVGDGDTATKTVQQRNITWGNLVDLKSGYGLDQIQLYPSQLSANSGALNATLLETPKYGSDGRITEMAQNSTTGTYNGTSFMSEGKFGVRAVGTASGMSERQLAFRNARSAAAQAQRDALDMAANSLTGNGSILGNIALAYVADGDSATYTNDDVAALIGAVSDLEDVLAKVEEAYLQYILAFAASSASGITDDAKVLVIKNLVEQDDATISGVLGQLSEAAGTTVTLPNELSTPISALNTTKGNVATAAEALEELAGESSVDWADIRDSVNCLADPSKMTLNGWKVTEAKEHLTEIFLNNNGQGYTIAMPAGSGVYADIADHVGKYSSPVTLEHVTVSIIQDATITVNMATNPAGSYLTAYGTVLSATGMAPAGAAAGDKPMTEFYGYIVDLAFRTNAAESNLMLDVQGSDRIYSDNTNEDTMGHGSNMTFASADPANFTNDQVKDLMKAIRIVFFTPDNTTGGGSIVATAKLDVEHATTGNDGVTADMYIYEVDNGVETAVEDDTIMALTQNTAQALSVMVYLDGNYVDNGDVATAENSMTGTMNLQFKSSANLTPMEYADLHVPASNSNGNGTDNGGAEG